MIHYFSVIEYGATGNGNTDDSIAIQNALNYIHTIRGGTLYFPPGTYIITRQITLYKDITLDFESGATIKREIANGPQGMFSISGPPQNIKIFGGILDANGVDFPRHANIIGFVGGENIFIEGTTFTNVPGYHAIDIANSKNIKIKNCRFLGFVDNSENECNDDNNRTFSEAIQLDPDQSNGGSDNERIMIDSCFFGPNLDSDLGAFPVGVGNHWSSEENYSKDISIINCTFDGMTMSGIRAINFLMTKISGNTFKNTERAIRIDINGQNTSDFSEDIIISGNFFENLNGSALYIGPPPNEKVKHKRILFSGNVINEIKKEAVLDLKWCTDIVVSNNVFVNGESFVSLRFCDKTVVSNNLVENTVYNAIWIYEKYEQEFIGKNQTRDIKIVGNSFSGCGYRGIHVNCQANGVTINGNTILDPDRLKEGREGIKIDSNPQKVMVLNNVIRFTDNSTPNVGISAPSGNDMVVRNNFIQ